MTTILQMLLALVLHSDNTKADSKILPDENEHVGGSTEATREKAIDSDQNKTQDELSHETRGIDLLTEQNVTKIVEPETDMDVKAETRKLEANEKPRDASEQAVEIEEAADGEVRKKPPAIEADETGAHPNQEFFPPQAGFERLNEAEMDTERPGIELTGDEETQFVETETRFLMPLEVGVIDELYNFVNEYPNSQVTNVDQASVSTQDSAGGVKKAAIFEHPRAEGYARIEYELILPELADDEQLILHFSIGLRDGVDFDYLLTKPDGVRFAIEISREQRFEDFSIACQWEEHVLNLSKYAGRQIQVAFLTDCNGVGNTNYDWAVWGNPRLLKLSRASSLTEQSQVEPEIIRGIALGSSGGESPKLFASEFVLDAYTPISEIANVASQRMQRYSADAEIVEFRLYAEQPQLEIVDVGPTAALVTAGDDFELQCTVRNTGLIPLVTANRVSVSLNRIKMRRGHHMQTIKLLNPSEETTLVWQIRSFSRQTATSISASLRYQTEQGEIHQTVEKVIEVRPGISKLSTEISQELHTCEMDGHVITENRNLRALFVRGYEGFEYYLLFAAKNGHYREVAVCNAISEIRYRDAKGNIQHSRITPSTYRLSGNSEGESIVLLSCEEKDIDGVLWSYEVRFSIREDSKLLKTEHRLVTDAKRELIVFNGPMLYAGDGTFGGGKNAALFPGLEFLENGESSSDTRDAAPPLNNRLVPHPYKITIPLMAVEHNKSLVGLMWNPMDTWDGKHKTLSAIFASPNWYMHQKNHLMGLFLPTPPDWVHENSMEASTPYLMEANHPIMLNAQIILDGNASILDAISLWTDAYGMPDPLKAPRSDEDELLLSRHGFMQTVWDEETGKSRHCVDWKPANAPGFATLLWYDYLATRDESVRQRVVEIAENTIRESGDGSLISSALCHIMNWEFPFYYGHLETSLDRLKEITRGLIEAQQSNGSWGFNPATDRARTLGEAGDTVLGICAHPALMLLKHARITGDEESLAAGLRALRFMERFQIPRGAQVWECPIYQPDLLAAAHAVAAYVEGYEITNEKINLECAEHWAETGLPFLYYWNLPDRPGMRFASIPVFGTTFHTHPWFGVPVQWNGLVFAYYLQQLAPHSNRQPWSKIAESITVSAMYQQWTGGELKGTYPDGFYGFCTERRGPHLNPENIMVNLYALRGLDPDISTAIIRYDHGRIHVSTGAKIDSVQCDDSAKLDFKLRYVQHETSYTIITGFGRKPAAIRAQHKDIADVDNLEAVESGWLHREEKDIIFMKYKHSVGEIDFEVLPPVQRGAREEIPS